MSTNPVPPIQNADETDSNSPIGTKATGYAGPDQGPFACSNCEHFDGSGNCDHPQVMADPEVKGKVDAQGCCNLFRPEQDDQAEPGGQDELKTAIQNNSNPFKQATGNWAG